MAITASMVKELRDRTGVAMMKCKQALSEADGDMEAAVENLRKQGAATADKKSDRETNAGGLGIATSNGVGALVLVSCETDFVSGNDMFKTFVNSLAEVAAAGSIESVDALKEAQIDGKSVADALVEKIQQLGENMQIASISLLKGESITGYNHGGRVATLVAGTGDEAVLRNVAMHVAAANPAPVALDRDSVDSELVEKERNIIAESPDVQAKPEQIQPKIIEGKMGRFYKENVLLEQEMLVDNEDGLSVEKYAAGKGASVAGFVRTAV